MKHKGSISQTNIRRDDEVVPSLYRRAFEMADKTVDWDGLFRIAADLPVNRFYISDDAAIAYVRMRMLGKKRKTYRSPYKQRLFEALYDIVSGMMKQEKYSGMGIPSVTVIALSRPAPCIGLTPSVIKWKYLQYRKKARRKRNEKIHDHNSRLYSDGGRGSIP